MVGEGDGSWDARSRDFGGGSESEAFWPELLDELRPLVAARLPGRSHEWEDVLQETVLSLLEARATGRFERSRGSVAAFAARIAQRRCADRARAAARRPTASLDAPVAVQPVAREPGPEEIAVQAEASRAQRRALGRAIRELQRDDALRGSRRAHAVLLRFRFAIADDDLGFADGAHPSGALATWEEVAERLGITVEAARQNGSRGLRALRERWRRGDSP